MLMLLLQIFLLLLAAYLAGAMTACILKRAFAAEPERPSEDLPRAAEAAAVHHPAPPVPPVKPSAQPAPVVPPAPDRFGRALAGDASASAAPPPATSVPVVEVRQPAPPPPPPSPPPARQASSSPGEKGLGAAAAAAAASAAATHAALKPSQHATAPHPAPPPPPPPTRAVAAPVAPAPPPQPAVLADDLKRIRAVDAAVEARLRGLGVTRFSDIAGWSADDVNRMSQALGFAGRIEQENWIEQAQILAKGGETSYSRRASGTPQPVGASVSTGTAAAIAAATGAARLVNPSGDAPRPVQLADAIREQSAKTVAPAAPDPAGSGPRTDYTHLRSVRSEALRGEAPAFVPTTGSYDDLKRIRGIGVLLEKKLNALGITSYEQIARWTGADIERYGEHIEPRGRIERENWIEQARILASGGQTEYARRFDRGELGPTG